jgi:WD40 repeat protein
VTGLADKADFKFDLFLSYRRSDGLLFANWLRRRLLAYRLPRNLDKRDGRRLTVYQDKAYERATEDFWKNTVLPAIRESRYLGVVVTSATLEPRSDGQPNWVEREIAAFSEAPQASNIFILNCTGATNDRLPGDLQEKFPHIQRVDLRDLLPRWKRQLKRRSLEDSLLAVVATLYDALPEDMPILRQEEERRRRRTAWATAFVSIVLLLIMGWLAFGWRRQRDEATKEREIAVARQLAAQASLLERDSPNKLDRVALLDVESLRRFPTFDADYQLRSDLPLLRRELLHLFHEGRVLVTAFSRDGRFIATGSLDQTARVYEVSSGKEVARLTHGDTVISVAFSPDGNYVATGSYDKTARVLGRLNGKEVARIGLDGRVVSVAFSPDGEYVAAGSDTGTFAIFDALSGRVKWHFDRPDGSGTAAVAFSPSGHQVIFESGFHTMVFGIPSFKQIWMDERLFNQHSFIALSADGRFLASPSGGLIEPGPDDESFRRLRRVIDVDPNSIDIRECGAGKLILHLKGKHEFNSAAFSPNGDLLAVGNEDGSVRVYDRRTGKAIALFNHGGPVESVNFSPNGRFVATASRDHTARVFEALTGREVARLIHEDVVRSAVFSPNGQDILTGSLDGSARLFEFNVDNKIIEETLPSSYGWEVFGDNGFYLAISSGSSVVIGPLTGKTRDQSHFLSGGNPRQLALGEISDPVAFSSDGRYLADATNGRIVDLKEGTTRQTFGFTNHAVAFSPDGRYLAAGGDHEIIYVADLKTGSELSHFKPVAMKSSGHQIPSVQCLAFSPDGKYLAAGGTGLDGAVQLFEPASGKIDYSFHFTEPKEPMGLVFSPNGRYLSVVLQGLRTKVLDLGTKKELWQTLDAGGVPFPAFSPDSSLIATSSSDHTARVFETASGREVTRIPVPHKVKALTFTSDGRSVIVASVTEEGADSAPGKLTISEHSLVLRDLVDQACSVLAHNLSPEDWQHFLPDEPYQHHRPCANLP